MLRTLCMMGPGCHAGLVFLSSWQPHESVVSSTVADQLLILLPAWRAWASPISLPGVYPISSGSMHSPAPLSATGLFSVTNLIHSAPPPHMKAAMRVEPGERGGQW
jgi:hypothetical protein